MAAIDEVRFSSDVDGLRPDRLGGFFVGWPSCPTPQRHLEILRGSSHVELAWADGRVVGFANAISDGGFCAFISLLEVLPAWQRRGIGRRLIERLVGRLEGEDFYSIDLACDAELAAFYEPLGFVRGTAMLRRVYGNQSG